MGPFVLVKRKERKEVRKIMSKAKTLVMGTMIGVMAVLVVPATSFAQGPRRGLGDNDHRSPSPLVQNFIGKRGVLINVVVTGLNGTTINAMKDGKAYTIDASSARIRARFWGTLTLADIQVNDHLNVWGSWVDQARTSIKARLIRDLSDQRRAGTFFGTIAQVGSNTFVLKTFKRGDQNVSYVSGQIVDRRNKVIPFSDLKVGDRVRVRGLWDRTNTNITVDTSKRRNSQVKDFSIPARSPRPSATP